ncbi:type I-E CRISPR-associated protein Cas5/CasD [Azoarcus sp. DN11]|uniref:type I-E CRISPR-associated protein Cas5/CasD n=1 Tax=Azoarcus sp. DN11 TaxID=356837 RepID=UPI000EB04273|nr:type I-E CRISPR-associated protein Cas5/CasD [Azoarcus sp. DN11]AYH45838.1 type I-E CRISPR-associated protein Cas5/CasD [Azoarcus sp. DN11]
MANFLILQLDGVLQAWGDHSFEDYRPTVGFPTRSGLLGLLAACLGIDRGDTAGLTDLDHSVWFTVRAEDRSEDAPAHKLTDYHTVLEARTVDIRKPRKFPVESRREYLCDAIFSVAVEQAGAVVTLDHIAAALQRPVFTPSLGRRSCPLSRPLFAARLAADNPAHALQLWSPRGGTLYSDSPALASDRELRLRDVPRYGRVRQFGTRRVFVSVEGAGHVPE